MSCVFPLIALVAFWVLAIRLWVFGGRKIALICIGLWSLGLVVLATLELGNMGGYIFMGFEAVLALTMMVIAGCKGFL